MTGDGKVNGRFLGNGLTTAFKNGEQLPELQMSWFKLYCAYLVAQEIDPTQVVFESGFKPEWLPDGDGGRVLNW